MTEYVILRATNEAGTIFAILGEESSGSPQAAIRKWAAREESQGEVLDETPSSSVFAAVPKRSWTVAEITHQVTRVVRVKAL